jgi:hypothetical protein
VFTVFIASPAEGDAERRAVANKIEALKDFAVVSWEDDAVGTASPLPTVGNLVRGAIDKADVVVLIFAERYRDKRNPGADSALELEYNHAKAAKKPVFLFASAKGAFFAELRVPGPVNQFTSPDHLAAKVEATLLNWQKLIVQARTAPEAFEIVFAPQLTEEQVAASLEALADYYRACGGAGLQPDIELADVLVEVPSDVLA